MELTERQRDGLWHCGVEGRAFEDDKGRRVYNLMAMRSRGPTLGAELIHAGTVGLSGDKTWVAWDVEGRIVVSMTEQATTRAVAMWLFEHHLNGTSSRSGVSAPEQVRLLAELQPAPPLALTDEEWKLLDGALTMAEVTWGNRPVYADRHTTLIRIRAKLADAAGRPYEDDVIGRRKR